MSWDEALFRLAWKLKRGRRHAAAEPERQRAARLADLKTSLTLVARALSGEALDIQEAEHVGGYAGQVIYLPRAIHLAPTPTTTPVFTCTASPMPSPRAGWPSRCRRVRA